MVLLMAGLLIPEKYVAQQDVLRSMNNFNMQLVNPAYTGFHNQAELNLSTRLQWRGFNDAPTSNYLNGSTSIYNNRMGVGFILGQDKFGVNNNIDFQLTYAYKLKINEKSFINFGVQAGLIDYRTRLQDLNVLDPDDPFFPTTQENVLKFNMGAGIIYNSQRLFLGLSVPRLIKNKFEENLVTVDLSADRHVYFNMAYLIDMGSNFKFKPSIFLRYVSGAPLSVDYNLAFLYKDVFWFGGYTRNFNDFGAFVRLTIKEVFHVAYSIEVPGKEPVGNNYLSHEIILTFDMTWFKFQYLDTRYF